MQTLSIPSPLSLSKGGIKAARKRMANFLKKSPPDVERHGGQMAGLLGPLCYELCLSDTPNRKVFALHPPKRGIEKENPFVFAEVAQSSVGVSSPCRRSE